MIDSGFINAQIRSALDIPSRAFCISVLKSMVLGMLVLAIFLVGAWRDAFFIVLDAAVFKLVAWAELDGYYSMLLQHTHEKITMRGLPSMLLYGLLYCLLCLTSLVVYFGQKRKVLLAAGFYGCIFALCLLLIFMGKIFSDFIPAYNLARRLIEMIVSPLPVVLFIATFMAEQRGLLEKWK